METVESVLAQTHPPHEIVLVDDGSTDGCGELIERRFDDPRLRVVRQPHQGLGAARRASVDRARGDYLAFLDHDDLWLPQKLERQIALLTTDPDAGLIFSDCFFIDSRGTHIGRLSDRYDYASIDVTDDRPLRALLAHGCFIDVSTVLASACAVRAAGNFDPRYRYVEDYDMWLRIARRHRLRFVPEPLAKRRIHEGQFTQRRPDIALREQVDLLRPFMTAATYPVDVRHAVRDYVFGQHLECGRRLLEQRRIGAVARATLGMFRYPRPLADRVWSLVRPTRVGQAIGPLARIVRRGLGAAPNGADSRTTQVWIDGSPLAAARTGYFNFTVELIRALAGRPACEIDLHVVASREGVGPLRERLGDAAARLKIHSTRPRPTLSPRRRSGAKTIELVVWRGRFRYGDSRKVALVQDLTTRLHPELHTARNVAAFDEYLRYVLRHAETIATISEHSRDDIIDRLNVFPPSVRVIPKHLHPIYARPAFSHATAIRHGICDPYLLCVSTVEPRKNLRRLVQAFEAIAALDVARGHVLVLAGPSGWDDTFMRDLSVSPVRHRIRALGFVPLEDLPSLYHFASAVVYPSLHEGFGLPVLEAMCCSALVLTSRVSSLPEVLGEGGMYFDPRKPQEIAAAIASALALSADETAAYRRYCRSRAEALLAKWATEPLLPGL